MPEKLYGWITAALDDESSLQALVLAKSLRRSITKAQLLVLTTHHVSECVVDALAEEFDVVVNINAELDLPEGLSSLDYAKLFCWSLTAYSKCIFINSDMMLLDNLDELFDCPQITAIANVNKPGMFDTSFFVLEPSYKEYKNISKLLDTSRCINGTEYINEYFSDWKNKSKTHRISSDIFINILSESNFEKIPDAVRIVRFLEAKPWHHINDKDNWYTSLPENAEPFCKLWAETFWSEIAPTLTPEMGEMFGIPTKIPVEVSSADDISKETHDSLKDSIAIIGHSCRFPGANSIEEYWELLKAGGDGITAMPIERLNEAELQDPMLTSILAGYLKCPIDEFDAKFFGISPREAAFMDPQQRLLVEVAWEALENAAINPKELKGTNTAVYTGVWTHDYERVVTEKPNGKDFHHVILGNAFSATSARVSYFLGLNGANIVTESGCSSSMVSLHLACKSLRRGETNLAIAGGVNLLVAKFPYSEVVILAKDGHCKTFDEKGDGFARAEGVGVVILKRYSDAIKDGDRIMGIIRGSGVSNEGTTSSFGTPSKHCQELAIKEAIKDANIKPSDVDYVEAHGTGTPIGDPIEFSAIASGYSGQREQPLVVGSVKTNIGHTESAAGLAGLIKVVMSMRHETIPPHINFQTLNPNINLESVPAVIPVNAIDWPKTSTKRRLAGISSFGISGTNVHVILEEPPIINKSKISDTKVDRQHNILTISAKNETALKDLAEKYVKFFDQNPEVNVADVAFTANTGRAHFKHRMAIVGKNTEEIKTLLSKQTYTTNVNNEKPIIGFLFTGQGSQYPGMAKNLYETNSVFRHAFNECAVLLENNNDISLKEALWSQLSEKELNEGGGHGSPSLNQTVYSQSAIFCVEYSLLKVWESLGVKPDYVLGHSVGEFAAATAAGIISLEDAISLVYERSQLIYHLPPGGMLAVRVHMDSIEKLIASYELSNAGEWIDIAAVNSDDEIVVAGKKETLEKFVEFCKVKEIKTQGLAASHAFHSRDMEEMMHAFGLVAAQVKYKAATCNYISGSTGQLVQSSVKEINSKYWQNHARERVNFASGIKSLEDHGCNIFIEIGAHPVLLALSMANLSPNCVQNSLWLPSIRRNEEEWRTMLNSLAKLYYRGFDINWRSLDVSFKRNKLELPTYAFQRQKYWVESSGDSDGLTFNRKYIHPLLGSRIPLAGINDNIFQHCWDLKNLSYVQDHQVANVIVLPGAGFLEVILAAAKQCIPNCDDKFREIILESFAVEAPFELETGKQYKIQIVSSVDAENPDIMNIKLYNFRSINGYNDEKGWKCYASAKFVQSVYSGEKILSEKINDIKSRCPIEASTEEFYKKAPEIGIFFGETFQSISKVWKGTNEIVAEIPIPSNAGNMSEYLFHPIVLDAMIQAFGYSIGEDKKDLYLPIGVEKFRMMREANLKSSCYTAHACWSEGPPVTGIVKLYDEFDNLMCYMEGIRLVKTTITSFLNVINSQKNKLPGLYQEVWRGRDGPLQGRIDFKSITPIEETMKFLTETMADQMPRHEILPKSFQVANKLVCVYILDVLRKVGWNPKVGYRFETKSLMNELILIPGQESLFERMLGILCEDGYLSTNINEEYGTTEYEVITKFPTDIEMPIKVAKAEDDLNVMLATAKEPISEFPVLKHCVKCLPSVLLGKQTAVSALFSEENDIDLFSVYTHGIGVDLANIRLGKYMEKIFENCKGSMVRILEVGAGSGATSKYTMMYLQKEGIPFRYTFTDISPHFMEAAKKKFKDISGVEYKVLNIEKDPKSQGFVPFHYDVIIAANVMHATDILRQSLSNVRKLLAPGGLFVLQEMLQPLRHIDMIFGLLDGYWRFKDFDIRQSHPTINEEKWAKLLADCGFVSTINISDPVEYTSCLVSHANDCHFIKDISTLSQPTKQKHWVIFCDEGEVHSLLESKLESVGEKVLLVQKDSFSDMNEISSRLDFITSQIEIGAIIYLWGYSTDTQQENFCLGLLNLCKYFMISKTVMFPKFFLITKGIHYIGDQGAGNPANATLWGIMKTTKNERPDTFGKAIDVDPDNTDPAIDTAEIFSELWDMQEDLLIAFRHKRKFVIRITALPNPQAPLTLPNQHRYTLTIPKTKAINDVTFRPMPKTVLEKNFVEVSVRACALNFRDILVILKPDMYHTLFEAVGTDFSGIVTEIGPDVTKFRVGDEVFGISNVTAVASHVIVPSDLVLSKPAEFTHAEASTLPSVFLTAYYCLFNVAKLKAGETILIHVASGGVGLVAIQLAKLIGANIIATAGSKRKRTFLRSIGVKNVFHSRDTTYGAEIEKCMGGKGVDMVLNSLTGPNFKETSLKSCNQKARFVEMGKVNIWKPEEVKALRPDVVYTIVDLERVQREEMAGLFDRMDEIFKAGSVKPLEYIRFDVTQIKEALNYFLKAHHIGKIVVSMPEIQLSAGKMISKDLLFNQQGTYIVTGGLGGIGFEVAKWMVNCGAKHVVLVGRSPPKQTILDVLKSFNARGANIMTMQVDVGDWNQCKNLFETIKNPDMHLPPLRGIMHSAGALSDGIIANQTWEKFNTVFNAKVKGGWNLHNLSKDIPLEHFVLFSSMSGIIGGMGQSNHSAANMFLDSLAHYRHSLGLPAQSINWGAWSEVGAATNTAYGNEGMFGVKPFTPTQGIAALKFIMSRPFTQIGVVQLDAGTFKESFSHIGSYLDELVSETPSISSQQSSAEAETFWAEIKELNEDERVIYIKKHLESIMRQTLRLPESEVLDEHQTFSEMGLDSLMAVEMRNKLQQIFGKHITLNATSLLDYPTLGGLSKFLTELTLKADLSAEEPLLEISSDEVHKMIIEDSILPAHVAQVGDYVSASRIQNVFITGASGHVGVHILHEILKTRSTAKVWCLIRGKTIETAKKRVLSSMKKFNLLKSTNMSRVTFLLGNVSQANLALSKETYEELAKTIDCVIHCAAKVNHVEEYRKSKSFFDVRSVNVFGTLRMLEFASTFKTKHFIYPTSSTAANVINEKGFLAEECPLLENNGEGINVKSGYALSKFISEKLIGQAIDRGIPCVVLRYTSLIGNSHTGLFTLDTNWLMAACISFGQLGVMPNLKGGWYTIPIDVATDISCKLIFNDEKSYGLYNVLHPYTMKSNEFSSIVSEYGFDLQVVEVKEFSEKVQSEGENSMLSMFKDKFPVGEDLDVLTGGCPTFKLGLEKGQIIYCFSEKLSEIMPGFEKLFPHPKETILKQLEYAKQKGIFKAAGLNV